MIENFGNIFYLILFIINIFKDEKIINYKKKYY